MRAVFFGKFTLKTRPSRSWGEQAGSISRDNEPTLFPPPKLTLHAFQIGQPNPVFHADLCLEH
jgi:hypothetical protein